MRLHAWRFQESVISSTCFSAFSIPTSCHRRVWAMTNMFLFFFFSPWFICVSFCFSPLLLENEHTCLSATTYVLIWSQRRFWALGLVISAIWNCCGFFFWFKTWELWLLKDDQGQNKNVWKSIHYVFVLIVFFFLNMIGCGRTRQLSSRFVCADLHTRSLKILLYLPFNLGLFTRGLNISPLRSGHLPIKKCASRAVEVIYRGVECIRWYFARG